MNQTSAASAYATTQNQTAVVDASPHRQIALLFAGALDRIHQAKGAMEKRDLERKSLYVGKVVDILSSLQAWLDMEQGGEISANLFSLYDYMIRCMHEANLHNDPAKLDEVARLLSEVKSGWDAIGPEVDG